MRKTQIPIIAVAVFSMVILLAQGNLDKAFALEAYYYNVTAPRNTVEILDGVTSSAFGNGGTSKFIGEGITAGSGLIGQQINKVGIHLEKVTDGQTLFGTIYVGFWNVSPEPTIANALQIFGSMSANSVADAETLYNFTLSTGNYTIPVNSAVGAFYIDPIGSGSGSDGIYISGKNNAFGGNPTRATCHVNNSTTNADCFNTSVCTLGCGGQWSVDTTTDIIMLMSATITEEGEEGNQSGGFCGNGTLRDCLGDRNALSGLVPANQNITSIATTLGQGIGIINPNDENPRTNGTGLFLMLITGSFFAIALMSTVHTLNMRGYISASIREIDPVFWLFLVVGTVSVAWYLDWIDDIIFFAMTVGLAGLIAFGVLKHFGRA